MTLTTHYIVELLKRVITISLIVIISSIYCACTDDFEPLIPVSGDIITFSANVESGWESSSRSAREQTEYFSLKDTVLVLNTFNGGESLYLHSRSSYNVNNPFEDNGVSSRGEIMDINDYSSFGLFASVYDNSWSEEKCSVNYIYNNECKRSSNKSFIPSESFFWPGLEQLIRFWGYAPYNHPSISISPADKPGSPAITFSVPEDNSSQFDLMTVMEDGSKAGDGSQHLVFKHALTAIQFVAANDVREGSIKKISINGVYSKATSIIGSSIWEDFSNIADFNIEFTPNISTGSSNSEQQLVGNDNTFFMIPQILPEAAEIVVEFIDITNTTRVLRASIANNEWEPGTIVTYHISTKSILYTPKFEINSETYTFPFSANPQSKDFIFSSYTEVSQVGVFPTYQSEPFELQLVNEDESPLVFDDNNPPYITMNLLMQNTSDVTSKPSANILSIGAVTKSCLEVKQNSYDDDLGRESSIGSFTNPVNLADKDNDGLENTANCYIVSAPGCYKLPIVYGNAIKDGNANTDAFIKNGSASTYTDYVNYRNKKITQPYIYSDTEIKDASLVWQDVKGLLNSVNISSDSKYVIFTVSKECIREGNAVIAVRDNDGNTVWSWHIWVRAKSSDSDIPITYSKKNWDIMGSYIGYCHPSQKSYPTRKVKVKLYQPYTNITKYITIILEGANLVDVGNSVYYQWGRKDALPGQMLDFEEVSNKLTLRSIYKPIYDDAGNEIIQPLIMGQVSIPGSILNPLHQAGANGAEGITWLDNGYLFTNLWNNSTTSITIATNKTTKTVYDPCPEGYVVAPPILVRYFNNGLSEPTVSNSGFYYLIENNGTTFKFPWTLRKNSTGYFNTSTSDYQKEDFLVWFTNYQTSPIINPTSYSNKSISVDILHHENLALPLLPVRQY